MDSNQGGLKGQVMIDFFASLLDLMGQVESSEALYHNYTTFCLARDVEPASDVDFAIAFRRLLSRIAEVM